MVKTTNLFLQWKYKADLKCNLLYVGLHQFWFLSQTVQEDIESYYEAYICMGTMFDESDLKVKHTDLKL